jgi:ABC-type dipeptide/oligopeptide/nickel transport system permease subunit
MKNETETDDVKSLNTPLNGGIACGLILGVIGGPLGALVGVILGATAGFYYDKKERSLKNNSAN